MPYAAERGHCLLIPSGSLDDEDKKHLFVVLTKECKGKQHLLVPISSIKPKIFHDPACVLKVGEHPFIKVESFAMYRLAQTITSAHITKCVDGWVYMQKPPPAKEETLTRLGEGLEKSDFTPMRILTYFAANK